MTYLLLCLVTLGGLAWYVMHPPERDRAVRAAKDAISRFVAAALRLRRRREPEPLVQVLRERTPLALATPALVAANVAVFVGLLLEAGAMTDPASLLRWGASAGPETTNGEWWRLLSSSFVHAGVMHLCINAAALLSVGVVLERLVGPVAYLATYTASAVMGAVAALAATPSAVTAGAGAAIFGLYGLLVASWTWGAVQRATTTVRLRTVLRLTPAAALFIVYQTGGTGIIGPAAQAALVTGFVCGLALAQCAREAKPPARRIAVTVGMTACLALAAAVPLRGMTDIRPEIARLLDAEARQAREYDRLVDEFQRGVTARADLVSTIEQTILPQLAETRIRLQALQKVPREHKALLAAAETYLRLRTDGWQVRAAALRRSSLPKLREADALEQSALKALDILKQ